MASKVFECPFCGGQFRVPSHTSHVRMLCPHCRQTVDLRGSEGDAKPLTEAEDQAQPVGRTTSIESIVIECPSCEKKFQVHKDMDGQRVGCPHCRSELQIVLPTSKGSEPEVGAQS